MVFFVDSLSDEQVLQIWDRTKKSINVSDLKYGSFSSMENQLKKQLQGVSVRKQATNTLLSRGFAKRALKTEKVLTEFRPTFETTKNVKTTDGKFKIKKIATGKTSVYSEKNLNIKIGIHKNKKAFFISSKKTKKRITWGYF
jgi:hypothetical protein